MFKMPKNTVKTMVLLSGLVGIIFASGVSIKKADLRSCENSSVYKSSTTQLTCCNPGWP